MPPSLPVITDIETWMLRFPSDRFTAERPDEYNELIGLNITDESGAVGSGWAYTTDFGGGPAVKTMLDEVLIKHVLGKVAIDSRAINNLLRTRTVQLGWGIASFAISAIDIALWDLRARTLGISMARALGQTRDRIPAYGSGKASPSLPVEDLVSSSVEYIKGGFDAVKLRVGRAPEQDISRLNAVREAIGPEPKIMCDANERLALPTALRLGRQMEQHGVYWFEEPLKSGNIDGYTRLRSALKIPIAAGEHAHSLQQLVNLVATDTIDIVQPDVCLLGGITPALDVGRYAEALGKSIAPHFMTELHIHLAAALPNTEYVEYYPFMDDILVHHLQVEDGHVLVPERPGHGVEFTPEAWSKYRVD